MDNGEKNMPSAFQGADPEEGFQERPRWQVWGARIGLVIFLIFVALQVLSIARGGL
ncbi:MAG: hypothetical protein J6V25_08200 [Oscillospiraceae bacterium]|nr:hypothetical protein [Oscillospiraceae bacterium]